MHHELKVKKPRHARIRRTEVAEIEEDGHSWAVSYADFLMVLLSFFILFFSTSEQPNEVVRSIAAGMKGVEGAGGVRKGSTVYPKEIESALQGFSVKQDPLSKQMLVVFEGDVYGPGAIELASNARKQLEDFFKVLEPYKGKLILTFIGHTDGKAIDRIKGDYIQNNFDLSVLRATRALSLAMRFGFSPEHLAARGAAEHERASRTLSIGILAVREGTGK